MRRLLIALALAFVLLFLVLPLAVVFHGAFAKGWATFAAALAEVDTRHALSASPSPGSLPASASVAARCSLPCSIFPLPSRQSSPVCSIFCFTARTARSAHGSPRTTCN